MTEQTMRIDDALSRSVLALEKGAAALERIANELENHRKGADAARGQLEQTTRQLERGLQMVTALMASVAGAVDQAEEEKKDDESDEEEDDEGQIPQPVADEAPAKPEPAAKAEPAAAPVEVKQDEEEKPAAKTEAPKPEATAPEAKAEQAEPELGIVEYAKAMRSLNAEFEVSKEQRQRVQRSIREQFGLKAIVDCEPSKRRLVVESYRAALVAEAATTAGITA